MKYAGVDYHKNFSWATVIDVETGEVRQSRLDNTRESFKEFLGDGKDTKAVIESGRCWGWMYDMLGELCEDVKVAHPLRVRAIAAAKIKNDKIDSKVLAQLLSADLIPESYARNAESRGRLAILRQRTFWVQMRTRIKNRIHDLVDRQGEAVMGSKPKCSDLFGKAGLKWLGAIELPPSERALLDEMLEGLEFVKVKIGQSDRRVKELYDSDPVAQRLRSIPGIGEFYAVLIRNEIDDIARFPSPEKLHSYAGLVPTTRASGGKVVHGGLTNEGNRWLRWASVEAAIPARNANIQLRMLYDRHKRRKGKANHAKVVVAKRILTIVYRVWKENRVFEEYKSHHKNANKSRLVHSLTGPEGPRSFAG